MSNQLTPALCDYLKELGLPIFITPSRNSDTGKVEVALYIFEIPQKVNEDATEDMTEVQKILDEIHKASYVGEK